MYVHTGHAFVPIMHNQPNNPNRDIEKRKCAKSCKETKEHTHIEYHGTYMLK